MDEAPADPSSHRKEEGGDYDYDDDQSMEEQAAGDEEEEDTWKAYLRAQDSRRVFMQYYRCRPMALLGKDDVPAEYDEGNRVVMPQSALDRLSSVKVEYPMVFRIQNAAAALRASHVGVQEFVADEGFVHVPAHTMARLGLLLPHDGQDRLVLLTSTSLPKATSVKLQPHTTDFLGVKYPKEVLEYNFGKYTCMTVGDTITVTEGDRRYLLDVVEAKPKDAVSTIETDCEVDFLPPLDYKEPPRTTMVPPPTLVDINIGPGEERFVGVGARMDGKHVKQPAPASVKIATGQAGEVRFAGVGVRMDGKPVERQAPPASASRGDNQKNVLRFGAGVSIQPTSNAGKAADSHESKEAKRFVGKKYSLQG